MKISIVTYFAKSLAIHEKKRRDFLGKEQFFQGKKTMQNMAQCVAEASIIEIFAVESGCRGKKIATEIAMSISAK